MQKKCTFCLYESLNQHYYYYVLKFLTIDHQSSYYIIIYLCLNRIYLKKYQIISIWIEIINLEFLFEYNVNSNSSLQFNFFLFKTSITTTELRKNIYEFIIRHFVIFSWVYKIKLIYNNIYNIPLYCTVCFKWVTKLCKNWIVSPYN